MKRSTNLKAKKGFTLIELVIVIVILGILAAVAALSFSNMTSKAKDGVAKANLRAMKSAVMMYQASHNGDYPEPNDTGIDNTADDATAKGIGNFLDLLEKAAYQEPKGYTYTYTTEGKGYKLTVEKTGGDAKKDLDPTDPGCTYIFD